MRQSVVPQSSGIPTHPTRNGKGHPPEVLASDCLQGYVKGGQGETPQHAPWWLFSALAALQLTPGCYPEGSCLIGQG